jgi:hypothetical protein
VGWTGSGPWASTRARWPGSSTVAKILADEPRLVGTILEGHIGRVREILLPLLTPPGAG